MSHETTLEQRLEIKLTVVTDEILIHIIQFPWRKRTETHLEMHLRHNQNQYGSRRMFIQLGHTMQLCYKRASIASNQALSFVDNAVNGMLSS